MITEAEFTLSRTCMTKIRHLRDHLPRNDRDTSFSKWLNSEASKLKTVAGHLFPTSNKITGKLTTVTADRSRDALKTDGIVAGAVFATGEAICRVDYVEREGMVLRLYSIITKCVTSERLSLCQEFCYRSGMMRSEWRDSLELVALRVRLAQDTFPDLRIVPFVVAPLRDATCDLEGLHNCLSPDASLPEKSFGTIATALLKIINVAQVCQGLHVEVEKRLTEIAHAAEVPIPPVIGYKCKKCEFRVTDNGSGFDQCWGPLARVTPHMFDLAYMYFIQDLNGRPVADRLAQEGRVCLWDIPEEQIVGDYAPRELLQMDGTEAGTEIIDPALLKDMNAVPYPRHFLDIETIRSLLPVHRGSKVNGLTLFQFSVHIQNSAGEPYEHKAWLNAEHSDPNCRFLTALRNALGDAGSVLVWTHYEEQSFAELLTELLLSGETNHDLAWLRDLLSSGRIVDMHKMCFSYYWHPLMAGRTSIKIVLPAIWGERSPLKDSIFFRDFPSNRDPYSALSSEGTVSDGCGAMTAYLEVLSATREAADRAKGELLRYCWVDTLAMVAIWEYWHFRLVTLTAGNQPKDKTPLTS